MKKIAGLLIIGLLFGCEDSQTGLAPGTISGSVEIFDDSSNALVPKDVLVSLEGTYHSALSAENGYWEIANVPPGVYTIKYSKAGFISIKKYNVQFAGGGNYFSGYQQLGEIPPVTVTELDLSSDSMRIYMKGRVSSPTPGYGRYVSVYFDKDPIVIQPEMEFDFMRYTLVPLILLFLTAGHS